RDLAGDRRFAARRLFSVCSVACPRPFDRRRRVRLELELVEPSSRFLNGVEQGFLVGKVTKQGRQVCKPLVEGQHISIGWLGEIGADAVDNGVGHFMGYYVVRKTREHSLAR